MRLSTAFSGGALFVAFRFLKGLPRGQPFFVFRHTAHHGGGFNL
jgi:hypothetical protein